MTDGERWERLFDDLEAHLAEQERRERTADIADRTRRERAEVSFADRLMAQRGDVEVSAVGGLTVQGRVVDVGDRWCSLEAQGRSWVLPFASIVALTGLGRAADADRQARTARRFGFGWALRALARDRAPVRLHDIDGRILTGTVDVVGADYLELSEHAADLPRREANVRARRVVPFGAVVSVSSR